VTQQVTGSGIEVGESSTVLECVVTDNPVFGIWGNGDNIVVRNCQASNSLVGILTDGLRMTIEGNTCTENLQGIEMTATGGSGIIKGGHTVVRNRLSENQLYGIRMTGAGHPQVSLIADNTCFDNGTNLALIGEVWLPKVDANSYGPANSEEAHPWPNFVEQGGIN
jgi:hypothetical protein